MILGLVPGTKIATEAAPSSDRETASAAYHPPSTPPPYRRAREGDPSPSPPGVFEDTSFRAVAPPRALALGRRQLHVVLGHRVEVVVSTQDGASVGEQRSGTSASCIASENCRASRASASIESVFEAAAAEPARCRDRRSTPLRAGVAPLQTPPEIPLVRARQSTNGSPMRSTPSRSAGTPSASSASSPRAGRVDVVSVSRGRPRRCRQAAPGSRLLVVVQLGAHAPTNRRLATRRAKVDQIFQQHEVEASLWRCAARDSTRDLRRRSRRSRCRRGGAQPCSRRLPSCPGEAAQQRLAVARERAALNSN